MIPIVPPDQPNFESIDASKIWYELNRIANLVDPPAQPQPGDQKTFENTDLGKIWYELGRISIPPASPILCVKISLTSAQIISLNSAPVIAIPTPGLGKAIQCITSAIRLNFNTVPFTNNYVGLKINSLLFGNGNQLDTSFGVLSSLGSVFTQFIQNISGGIADTIKENESLLIQANVDSFGGDGSADIYICYRIIDL